MISIAVLRIRKKNKNIYPFFRSNNIDWSVIFLYSTEILTNIIS